MAGHQTEVSPRQASVQGVGDWLALLIGLVAVASMLLALFSTLFESVQ